MIDPAFFRRAQELTVAEISRITGAELAAGSDGETIITGLAALSEGGRGMLVYIDGQRMQPVLRELNAAAILCPAALAAEVPSGIAILLSNRPKGDFVRIARLMYPDSIVPAPVTGETGVSPAAHVAADAVLESGVIVEPGAVIGAGAAIGAQTTIGPNAVIGQGVKIGRQCHIGAGATIQCAMLGNRIIIHPGVRIGQDGFGYLGDAKGLNKIPQLGRVIIQDDVEIGANTTIDRGTLEDTIIGDGTKIDNLVQIAHNVRIGRVCAIAGNSGFSGSVTIGDGVLIGGGVGIADHLTIGSGARLAGGAGVLRDVPAGETWSGYPARPLREFFRESATLAAITASRRRNDRKNG